ncbi:hypothetical protein TNCV_3396071 [Trichonephila clavipes]|nr:hypothetical protein TNCV_3396071 [Trichonephila clavipes]
MRIGREDQLYKLCLRVHSSASVGVPKQEALKHFRTTKTGELMSLAAKIMDKEMHNLHPHACPPPISCLAVQFLY